MRALFIANTSWYLFNFRENTIREFVARGYEVHAIVGDERYVDELRIIGVKVDVIDFRSSGMNVLSEIINFYSMMKAVTAVWPDITFSFTPKINIYTTLFCRLIGKKIVINVSGLGRGANSRLRAVRYFILALHRVAMSFANLVYFQNPDDYSRFVGRWRVSEAKAKLLPGSGIPLEKFFHDELGRLERPIVFGMASRLIAEKGVRLFFQVARRFSGQESAKFILAGEQEGGASAITAEEINQAVSSGWIDYVGFVTNIPDFWRSCDVAVLPSSYPEGTPRSLIEAGAMGKIIVTTDAPGCRECVTPGAGFLVEQDSAESLYEAISEIIAMSDNDLQEMGRNTSGFIRAKFDERLIIEEYVRVAAKLSA